MHLNFSIVIIFEVSKKTILRTQMYLYISEGLGHPLVA